ncbi:MAG: hypothetical protein ACO3LE_10130 [Bdellovibrionota bacterium]
MGPRGFTGAQGEPGEIGPMGPQGPAGVCGCDGGNEPDIITIGCSAIYVENEPNLGCTAECPPGYEAIMPFLSGSNGAGTCNCVIDSFGGLACTFTPHEVQCPNPPCMQPVQIEPGAQLCTGNLLCRRIPTP